MGRTAQPGANRAIAPFLHCLVGTVSADVNIACQVAEHDGRDRPPWFRAGHEPGDAPMTARLLTSIGRLWTGSEFIGNAAILISDDRIAWVEIGRAHV